MDPKKLKKLINVWEQKLEKEGLKDIENKYGQLNTYHSFHFNHSSTGWDLGPRAEYYTRAEHFLTNHEFKNKTERKIWELHSQAVSDRQISKKVKINRAKIAIILRGLREEMKLYLKSEQAADFYEF